MCVVVVQYEEDLPALLVRLQVLSADELPKVRDTEGVACAIGDGTDEHMRGCMRAEPLRLHGGHIHAERCAAERIVSPHCDSLRLLLRIAGTRQQLLFKSERSVALPRLSVDAAALADLELERAPCATRSALFLQFSLLASRKLTASAF